MRDYATFKQDGIICKEEILFWRQINSHPIEIRFLTPTGLYKYEQTTLPDDEPHEWEQKTYSVIDYTSLNKVTKVCLVCKKCGKVKVLK